MRAVVEPATRPLCVGVGVERIGGRVAVVVAAVVVAALVVAAVVVGGSSSLRSSSLRSSSLRSSSLRSSSLRSHRCRRRRGPHRCRRRCGPRRCGRRRGPHRCRRRRGRRRCRRRRRWPCRRWPRRRWPRRCVSGCRWSCGRCCPGWVAPSGHGSTWGRLGGGAGVFRRRGRPLRARRRGRPGALGCGLFLSWCGDEVVHAGSVAAGAEVAGTRNRRVADAAVVVSSAISRAGLIMVLQGQQDSRKNGQVAKGVSQSGEATTGR